MISCEAGQTNDALDASRTCTHVPFKGLVPCMVHKRRRIAFCDVGAKEGQDFFKQVHVDLEDLALGREGRRVEGRHFDDHSWRSFLAPRDHV